MDQQRGTDYPHISVCRSGTYIYENVSSIRGIVHPAGTEKEEVENHKGMTLMKTNPDGRWKLDTTKMLRIILKTKESWLKCFHLFFPQTFLEDSSPPLAREATSEVAEEPKARLYFQFSALLPSFILLPSYLYFF